MSSPMQASSPLHSIDRKRLAGLTEREEKRFIAERPKSKALFDRARVSLLDGVPMNWMVKWAGPFPVFVAEAKGSHFIDADGIEYVDLCLGDTGAMTGHSPDAAADAIAAQARRGLTFMLPTEDSIWVGEELVRRFGMPYWQFTLTATDANRFSIRLAREITQRQFVLVFNYCYHGTVDESFASLLADGSVGPRRGNIGAPVNPAATTKVVEFNDLAALEAALASRDVACVLAEPVMTNVGIIHPDAGYHAALRDLTRRYGSLLILDETHTICAGPGGYSSEHALEPDMFVIGKPLASGIPAATYGFTRDVAERIVQAHPHRGLRYGRYRRHAGGQRDVAGGDARDARERPDARGVRANDPDGRALRARRGGDDCRGQAAVARDEAGLPGGVSVPHAAAPKRG